MNYWLVKQEPSAYSWDDFVRDGGTAWTGVRNFQARNNLRSMKLGDHVLFYHSVKEKSVIGEAEVVRELVRGSDSRGRRMDLGRPEADQALAPSGDSRKD